MPTTEYTTSGGINIAYQAFGDGPRDLVYVPGWVSNIELMWDDPVLASILRRLGTFARVITFDKRGTGMSDRLPLDRLPSLEDRMDDVRAVMDAVGSGHATLFGHSEGGNMACVFAATYPERTDRLVLASTYPKRIRSEDYPWAPTPSERDAEIASVERQFGEIPITRRSTCSATVATIRPFVSGWLATSGCRRRRRRPPTCCGRTPRSTPGRCCATSTRPRF